MVVDEKIAVYNPSLTKNIDCIVNNSSVYFINSKLHFLVIYLGRENSFRVERNMHSKCKISSSSTVHKTPLCLLCFSYFYLLEHRCYRTDLHSYFNPSVSSVSTKAPWISTVQVENQILKKSAVRKSAEAREKAHEDQP